MEVLAARRLAITPPVKSPSFLLLLLLSLSLSSCVIRSLSVSLAKWLKPPRDCCCLQGLSFGALIQHDRSNTLSPSISARSSRRPTHSPPPRSPFSKEGPCHCTVVQVLYFFPLFPALPPSWLSCCSPPALPPLSPLCPPTPTSRVFPAAEIRRKEPMIALLDCSAAAAAAAEAGALLAPGHFSRSRTPNDEGRGRRSEAVFPTVQPDFVNRSYSLSIVVSRRLCRANGPESDRERGGRLSVEVAEMDQVRFVMDLWRAVSILEESRVSCSFDVILLSCHDDDHEVNGIQEQDGTSSMNPCRA